jgi:transposase
VRPPPLDNNICERALTKAILHRKTALFFKTKHGAAVGVLSLSLIHTCELNRGNPLEYLVALQRYAADLAAVPGSWMPWTNSIACRA